MDSFFIRRRSPKSLPFFDGVQEGTIAELLLTNQSARSLICNLATPTHCKEIAPRPGLAYQDFLTLWKDADPDIPVLKQAKAEYAKLQ